MLLGFGPLTYGSFVHDTAHLHTTGVSDILSTDSCITAPAMLHKHYKRPGELPIRDRHQAREGPRIGAEHALNLRGVPHFKRERPTRIPYDSFKML
jgi:hypothetical protein